MQDTERPLDGAFFIMSPLRNKAKNFGRSYFYL